MHFIHSFRFTTLAEQYGHHKDGFSPSRPFPRSTHLLATTRTHGILSNSQDNSHTVFQRDTHHVARNPNSTVGNDLDAALYGQSPSPNHCKTHAMPSYLYHPPHVLSPPPQTATLSSLTTVAAHYFRSSPVTVIPALATSASPPHLHRAIKLLRLYSNRMRIRITTSEMTATYASCKTRPPVPMSLCTSPVSTTHPS